MHACSRADRGPAVPVQRIYSFDQQTSLNCIREVSATANDSAAAKDVQLAQVFHSSLFAAQQWNQYTARGKKLRSGRVYISARKVDSGCFAWRLTQAHCENAVHLSRDES